MDMNLKAESLEAWERLKKLSDEERKRVLDTVQSTLIQGMKLSPKELELLRKHTLGELTEEQFLEIIKNLIAQFLKTNGEEKLRIFLHRIIMEALPHRFRCREDKAQ
jgi:ribosomal protein S13